MRVPLCKALFCPYHETSTTWRPSYGPATVTSLLDVIPCGTHSLAASFSEDSSSSDSQHHAPICTSLSSEAIIFRGSSQAALDFHLSFRASSEAVMTSDTVACPIR